MINVFTRFNLLMGKGVGIVAALNQVNYAYNSSHYKKRR